MICAICGFNATTSRGMGSHLHKYNLSAKQYYDLYVRTDNEGICKLDTCNNETPFYGLAKGYQDHCCNSHAQLDKTTQDKIKSTCLKRYGFIELNLYWMHGFHWFNENNPNDAAKLCKWQEKAKLGHKQYKAAVKVWSNSDLLKHNIAIKNNLNYIVLWNNQDIIQFKQEIEGKIKK